MVIPTIILGRHNMFAQKVKKDFKKNYFKYLMVLPVIIYLILFCYKPMYGIIIAFQKYRPALGFARSQWVGFAQFKRFFADPYFWRVFKNTILISFWSLVFTFPAPIILALMLNEVKVGWFKRSVQTLTYIPHFIALVVAMGMVNQFCQSDGLITDALVSLGVIDRQNLLLNKNFFYPIYIISDLWKGIGWNSIIYLAALSSVDQEQYEAARIDGASRLQQMWYITLPSIVPTISMLLILKMGHIISVGSEKILLLYQPLTYEVADVISTYVYRKGLLDADFSYSTAISLFNSLINLMFLIGTNKLSKKLGQSGLV